MVFVLLITSLAVFGYSYWVAMGYSPAAQIDAPEFLSERYGSVDSLAYGLTFSWFSAVQTPTLEFNFLANNFIDAGSFEWVSVWVGWDHDLSFEYSELARDVNDYLFEYGTTSIHSTFVVPSMAIVDETWMRARITPDGNLATAGDYFTDEAEYYRVSVADNGGNETPEPATYGLLDASLFHTDMVLRSRWTEAKGH